MTVCRNIWALKPIWLTIVAFLLPLVLAIIPEVIFVSSCPMPVKAARCAYVIAVMAIMWLTEAIPIPATALMPIFLFPMLGVSTAKIISASYVTDTTMLFLGGLIIAVALEESGLHIRISLLVMRVMGAQPNLLMLGLMITTWFLSMWISNTAATTMMLPIIQAIITTVKNINEGQVEGEVNTAYEMDNIPPAENGKAEKYVPSEPSEKGTKYEMGDSEVELDEEPQLDESKRMTKHEMSLLAKAFSLSVAYGANIGGIATLTGTPPNLVLKDNADKLYALESNNTVSSEIEFAKWMGFAFPMSLLTLIVAWCWLQIFFLRTRCFTRLDPVARRAVNKTILKQYKTLGSPSMSEIQVLVVFVLLIIFWLARNPPESDGWGTLFLAKYVSDSTPCMLLGVLLFILPAKLPEVFCWAQNFNVPVYTPILTWQTVGKKLPWGVIVLLGGGFAIAKASKESGFSDWMGCELQALDFLPDPVMNFLICCVVAAATEITSNTATAQLLMPILSALAINTGMHPLYLMMSAAIACSFAFMLPVATPPNALVFSAGHLSIMDMFLAGLPMNVIGVGVLTLSINTWGMKMYDLDVLPAIFNKTRT